MDAIKSDGPQDEAEFSRSGVTIERRRLLWLPVVLAGGPLLRGMSRLIAQQAPAPGVVATDEKSGRTDDFSSLTFEEFARRWHALSTELLPLSKDHDECYAAQVAGLVARVAIESLPKLMAPRGSGGLTGGPSWKLLPCLTIEFRMEKGAEIRLHNHPPLIVITLCAQGELRYRHFEHDGDAPPCTRIDGTRFRVRETKSGVLTEGRTTSLTRIRDGMHTFVAGEAGARLIDFTCLLTGDSSTFSYVELSEEPIDPERRTYEAHWTGKQS